jgi:putative transcriptional regulator
MTQDTQATGLTGKLLIAMPGMADPQFGHSVVYICAHSDRGAMGIVINTPAPGLVVPQLLQRLHIKDGHLVNPDPVHTGGPTEPERVFVLHSGDYASGPDTLAVARSFHLTTGSSILHDIAAGRGPERALIALGYAGWGAGQLDAEILRNAWLTVVASPGLVFLRDNKAKWTAALHLLGADPQALSVRSGRA